MRLDVYLTSRPETGICFDAEKIEVQVDGDGELYVEADGKTVGVFARGMWTHAFDPAKAGARTDPYV